MEDQNTSQTHRSSLQLSWGSSTRINEAIEAGKESDTRNQVLLSATLRAFLLIEYRTIENRAAQKCFVMTAPRL